MNIPSKCSKWVAGKKSAIGDKAAVRKIDRPLVWDALPFATKAISTPEDVAQQYNMVSVFHWREINVSQFDYSLYICGRLIQLLLNLTKNLC